MDLLRRLWRGYCSRHTRSYLFGVFFLAATTALTVAVPRFVELAVDAMASREPSEAIGWAWAVIGAGLGVMGVRTLSRVLFFNPGREIEFALKSDIFAHLTRAPKRAFERLRPGEIISRGTNDTSAVRALVGFSSLQGLSAVLTLTFTLGLMLVTEPLLTLYCLGPLLLAAALTRYASGKFFGLLRRAQRQVATLSDRTLETFNGVATLQSFGALGGAHAHFDDANDELLEIGHGIVVIQSWLLPIASIVGNACLVIILYAGGSMVIEGELTHGELAAFVVYIRIMVGGLRMFGFVVASLQRGWIALGRVFGLLETVTAEASATTVLPPRAGAGRGISVRELTFSYPSDVDGDAREAADAGRGAASVGASAAGSSAGAPRRRAVLEDISFEVAPGEVVGVFGLTGSGKSTLLELIARSYEPAPGTLFVDGVDTRELSLPAYREALAYVPQDPFLFSQSIRDNIALSAPRGGLDDARIAEAAASAALTGDLAALPSGLDTRVGQRGVTLSGGQRQRVALARAFYKPFEILLLDDVLSAVDHATERRLIDAIYARASGATTLIVSHRISVLKRADRVLVLDEGRLVAAGTHEELLARGVEPYQRIHQLQQARARTERDTKSGEEVPRG